MTTAVTTTEILRHTTPFLSDVISNRDLRHRLISALQKETSSSPIPDESAAILAADTIETAISYSSTTSRAFSLTLAENLLLPLPNQHHPLPSFLLSLIRTLRNRHHDAAISLLRIFRSNPSLARSEIAPAIYDRLFSVHLVAVFRWLRDRRAQILPSSSSSSGSGCSLSKVSEEQASKLRELEREYEEILDQNCRVFAAYFEEVLVIGDENATVDPPVLTLKSGGDGDGTERIKEGEEVEQTETTAFNYNNPIWTETEASFEFLSSGSCSNSYVPFYPQRVSPKVLKPHESSQDLTAPVYVTESSLEENLTCSSSESEAESDIIGSTKRATTPMGTENKSIISPNTLKPQKSSNNLKAPIYLNSVAEAVSSLDKNLPCLPSNSEAENEEKEEEIAQLEPQQSQTQEQIKNTLTRSMSFPDYNIEDYSSPLHGSEKEAAPKDLVCPLTSNIFDEHQTNEEWFNKGNATCPITIQKLRKTRIPKTNHALKQLISRWKEQNPNSPVPQSCEIPCEDTKQQMQAVIPSSFPNSTFDGMVSELHDAINKLCMSEMLEESSRAVLQIKKLWRELNLGGDIQSMLSKPPIINRFMEILFSSDYPRVLQAVVFLLAEMSSTDNDVIQMLTQVDNGVEHIMALLKKGLKESVVLIFLLKPSTSSLVDAAIAEDLVDVANSNEEEMIEMCLKPKTAAVLLLAQIIGRSDEKIASLVAKKVLTRKAIGAIVGSLGAEWAEERVSSVEILLRCIHEDGTCRNIIAEKARLSSVLESFMCATEEERFKIVQFFSELVKLNRRTFNEQILHTIKEEGPLSTMHSLLIYLQTAHQDQFPVLAGFLLQLDLLVEPTKISIYSEEAIDTLISCLRNTHYPTVQLAAAETIVSLQGRFNFSGMPLTREVLLERAGLDRSYKTYSHMDETSSFYEGIEASLKEEKAADEWERKVASVLISHDYGLLFEALADGLKSRNAELSSACFVSATWLVYMLSILPDTGVQGAARVFFLEDFIFILKSSKDIEDKILSMLALKSFLHFDDGLRDLTSNAKDILRGLRELEGFSQMASEIMNVLVEEEPDSIEDIWIHKELIQVDCNENGEVLSVICFEDKIFSGHSDGTIKIWKLKDSLLHLLQKTKEHMKDVTSLAISESGETLYSGSLDRTVKVWSVEKAAIHLVQEHDMKDQIHNLVVTNSICCFIPHGTGIKVKPWNGESKLLNSNKYVKCLALAKGRLYCGCHDASIQEIDLATGKVRTIQSGSRKLLGKPNTILALQVHDEFIYAASSSSDGSIIKVWNTSTHLMVGSVQTPLEVRAMVVSSMLVYLGCKGGSVEIWGRKKDNRVDTLHTLANCKVLCMTLSCNEDILVVGTSDGLIQAWDVK